jgi:hypothetical protein
VTAVPEYPAEACPPGRPDFYAIADHTLVNEIPADGACTTVPPLEAQLLRPVWVGDSDKPALVERARKICQRCPALEACRRYATANLVEHGVLAGLSGAERSASWTRQERIAWRRRKTRLLYEADATVAEIAKVLDTPRRTIEADIAALGLSGTRRRLS